MKTTVKNKLIATLLCLSILMLVFPSIAYAGDSMNSLPETQIYTDSVTGAITSITIYNETHRKITMTTSNDSATCEVIGNQYYLDGVLIDAAFVEQLSDELGFSEDSTDIATRAVPSTVYWGKWTTLGTKSFSIYKLSATSIATILAGYLVGQGMFVTPSLLIIAGGAIALVFC